MDFVIPADHWVKLNESEKGDKYQDLARGMKNAEVMVIAIVIGNLGTVTKEFVLGLEDLEIRERVETIQTTAVLKSARILRRVPETFSHSDSNAGEKNYQRSKMIKIKRAGIKKKKKSNRLLVVTLDRKAKKKTLDWCWLSDKIMISGLCVNHINYWYDRN